MLIENTLSFLADLRKNNNRVWFEANRERYREIQTGLNLFTERLLAAFSQFDPTLSGLTAKDCSYRIYRDTRFSHDKTPYKTHIGIYICRGGKKSGYAGYYIHLEPKSEEGHSLLGLGLYAPEPKVLFSIREEIVDNGAQLVKAMNKTGFTLEREHALKRTPKGFPTDTEFDDLLRLKWFTMGRPIPVEVLKDEERLLEWCTETFKKTNDFTGILNRAVQFAYEEL